VLGKLTLAEKYRFLLEGVIIGCPYAKNKMKLDLYF
jgi:hypothetical protein